MKGWHGNSEGHAKVGKIGGTRTKHEYGPEHFRRLGKRGGTMTRDRYGIDHYSKIRKGK